METTEAFTMKMVTVLNHGFLLGGTELGSRLGLFDYLAKVTKPLTVKEIADAMKFKERYVKEWLGLMVCGGIIEMEEERFYLPAHRQPALSGVNAFNVASHSWLSSICAGVTDDLMKCFKLDGPKGLPYSSYPSFFTWREHLMSTTSTSEDLVKKLQLIPDLQKKLETGIEMCELGCSTGVTSIHFAQLYPNTKVYGYDISEEAISCAKNKAGQLGLKNVEFHVQDCCSMPSDWSQRFDYAYVYDIVHDVPESTKLLREIHRILKPKCFASIIDINMHTDISNNRNNPFAPATYGMSLFHCMPVSLEKDGEGLGAAWGKEKALKMLKAAGFSIETVYGKENEDAKVWFICQA